jgi:hypothetical protein
MKTITIQVDDSTATVIEVIAAEYLKTLKVPIRPSSLVAAAAKEGLQAQAKRMKIAVEMDDEGALRIK